MNSETFVLLENVTSLDNMASHVTALLATDARGETVATLPSQKIHAFF